MGGKCLHLQEPHCYHIAWESLSGTMQTLMSRISQMNAALAEKNCTVVSGTPKQHPHLHWRHRGCRRKQKLAERSITAADVITPRDTGLDAVNCKKFCCAQEEDMDTCIACLVSDPPAWTDREVTFIFWSVSTQAERRRLETVEPI
ncbi:hypothetical protein SRHO_G00079980 [Serrasalmus rhombeus]